jgi:hypothetical protein
VISGRYTLAEGSLVKARDFEKDRRRLAFDKLAFEGCRQGILLDRRKKHCREDIFKPPNPTMAP